MRRRTVFIAGAVATVVAGVVAGGVAVSQAAVAPKAAVAGGAPYIYPAVGGSKDPVSVMQKTGVKAFTLAFILAKGGCNPAWDGSAGLTSAAHKNRINAIRAAGGDVVISFGGYSGPKLGNACSNETQLAAAYQKVIDAYKLKVIDIDLEDGGPANQNEVGQSQKVLKALKIVKQKNPGITTVMTLGTGPNGLEGNETPVPGQAAKLGDPVDIWTIMPFDFGMGGHPDMGKVSIQASEGLHKQLKKAFPSKSDATIYRQQGISSMNGKTDVAGENVTVGDFKTMLAYCQQHSLARFTYWELNRDNNGLAYTKVIGQFKG
jgi:chitinase